MALAGFKVTKIHHPMALHDANMRLFPQRWKYASYGGHAIPARLSQRKTSD